MLYSVTGHEIYKHLGLKQDDHLNGVYAGWQQIEQTKAPIKIGRSVNPVAIQRGRSQGGADWYFGCYYVLPNRQATQDVERQLKLKLSKYNKAGTQTQTELYTFGMPRAISQIETTLKEMQMPIRNIVLELYQKN